MKDDSEKTGNKEEKLAVALRYRQEQDAAPVVLGVGREYLAEKVIRTAKESGVPVVRRPEAARALGKLRQGQEIPPELYEMVAQILVFIRYMDKKFYDDGEGERL